MNILTYSEPMLALEVFEPAQGSIYSIEQAAHLAGVPRRAIAVYYRHGLVEAALDPDLEGWYFNDEAIRTLRQIERLRNSLGTNLAAVKVVLELTHEVKRLRQEVRFLRRL
jgi:MerR family transcriptional regulator, heat shock protein HspR